MNFIVGVLITIAAGLILGDINAALWIFVLYMFFILISQLFTMVTIYMMLRRTLEAGLTKNQALIEISKILVAKGLIPNQEDLLKQLNVKYSPGDLLSNIVNEEDGGEEDIDIQKGMKRVIKKEEKIMFSKEVVGSFMDRQISKFVMINNQQYEFTGTVKLLADGTMPENLPVKEHDIIIPPGIIYSPVENPTPNK